jgi:hypothetical protein
MRTSALLCVACVLAGCANGLDETGSSGDVPGDVMANDAGDASSSPGRTSESASGAVSTTRDDAGSDASAVDATADGTTASNDASMNDAGAILDASTTGSTWATPVCDGAIGAMEYGAAANRMTTSSGQTWSVTWDAHALYVGLEGANVGEALVMYLGYAAAGMSAGQTYDGTRPSSMILAADAVVYAKQGYAEVRIASGGAWGAPATTALAFCGQGTTREIAVPWSAIGAGALPASFRWLGHAVSASGYAYGQLPVTLPSGFIGTSASFPNDYRVTSTTNGTGSFPFQTID